MKTREITECSGLWDFAFLGDSTVESVDLGNINFKSKLPVPGCFDVHPEYIGKRGLAVYSTTVTLSDNLPYRLLFNAVQHWCQVFLNGEKVAEHTVGFTPFHIDITEHNIGEQNLVVFVDNRLDSEKSPLHLSYYDWYQYGGISRPVELHKLDNVWIDDIAIKTLNYKKRKISVEVKYKSTEVNKTFDLIISCAGQAISRKINIIGSVGKEEVSMELREAALWSAKNPNLYDMIISLGGDTLVEQIGIRQIEIKKREILVNGEKVVLKGFNRHEIHPDFGFSMSEQEMEKDLSIMKDLGCNFIRGSHYPQDKRFLKLCDQKGFFVWNEAIAWGNKPEHLTDDNFISASLDHIDDMVNMSKNHPSIIIWGVLNEGASNDETCRSAYTRLLTRLRELDNSRPVTYASMYWTEDIFFDLADIVSINCYPGWYDSELDQITDIMDKVVQRVNSTGNQDKPLIISEIGAGALYGWKDAHQTRWSEQYQAKYLDIVIDHMFNKAPVDDYAGLSIWQFCDIRTTEDSGVILSRPRGFNNKGVLNEYRKPKTSFDIVKKHFNFSNL